VKRGHIAAGVVTLLAGLGLGLGLGLTVSAGASAGAATAAGSPRQVVLNCEMTAQTMPGSYVLACADDGAGLQRRHWTSWTSQLASGYGTEYENDCQPNCAEGHLRHYRALVMLWGSGTVSGHLAERRYTEVTIVYPAARPPVCEVVNGKVVATYPVTQTFPAR